MELQVTDADRNRIIQQGNAGRSMYIRVRTPFE